MEIDPNKLDPGSAHKLLIGSVVPRPIAWITTLAEDGSVNVAPFSFFNGVCSSPPTVSVSFSYNPQSADHKKDSLAHIQRLGEFVVHVATERHADAMNKSSADFPREVGEAGYLGLRTVPSSVVSVPRLTEAPAALECSLLQEVPVGSGPGSATVVLGRVERVYLEDGLADERLRVDIRRLGPLARLGGDDYCSVGEIMTLPRPRYRDL